MMAVSEDCLLNALQRSFGLSEAEASIVKGYADKKGKYDDGKFIVLKEEACYKVELS